VVIVGAGLAGLAAAHALARAGVRATLYEGSPRLGGRCWTERGAFAEGQVAERGGELIDTSHATLRALVPELGLALDDLTATEPAGSEPVVWFGGGPYTAAEMARDFAAVRPAVERDARVLGDALPTFDRHTAAQRQLDRTSAAQWIAANVPGGARSRFGELLVNAYGEELGGDPHEISAVTMVSLLAGSPRDRFSAYEESDQRYHVRGGNDQVVTRLAEPIAGSIETGSRLVAITRRVDGRYRLVLLRDGAEREEIADRVILALPFTLLRVVDTRGAGFSARKRQSIAELGMGRNTKTQLQFDDRFWLAAGGNGEYRLRRARRAAAPGCSTSSPAARRPRPPACRRSRTPHAASWVSWPRWPRRPPRCGTVARSATRGTATRGRSDPTRSSSRGSTRRSTASRAGPRDTSTSPASTRRLPRRATSRARSRAASAPRTRC
jgi:monoamine oxidase